MNDITSTVILILFLVTFLLGLMMGIIIASPML